MRMIDPNNNQTIFFAKSLFPCWPCVQGFAQLCTPLGVFCVLCQGCCHYCKGTEIRTITQPVYKGNWSRTSGGEPQKSWRFRDVATVQSNWLLLCNPHSFVLLLHARRD